MYRVWEKGQRVLLEVFSDTTLSEIAASRPPSESALCTTDSIVTDTLLRDKSHSA